MSSSIRFCTECNNMLYPKENRREKSLFFACRNCDHAEEADVHCVYRHELIHYGSDPSSGLVDLASDPTLPRSHRSPCPKCGHAESVFFQNRERNKDLAMTLQFVCCNTNCNHRWSDQ